jgi:hypothetical protein
MLEEFMTKQGLIEIGSDMGDIAQDVPVSPVGSEDTLDALIAEEE